MPEPEKQQIEWIGGYPRVVTPQAQEAPPLEQQVLSDEEWEKQAKAKGYSGWALTQAFVRRVLGGE